jgi:methylthioribose-1-phosphate isomerase
MALARVFLAAVERVETHPVNQGARLMKFLLAAEEVDSQ